MDLISVTMEQAYQNSLRSSVEAISNGLDIDEATKILAGVFLNKSVIQVKKDLEKTIYTK